MLCILLTSSLELLINTYSFPLPKILVKVFSEALMRVVL